MTTLPLRAALIVGHPGHELRLFHWLERVRPLVFVLTDGSGSGRSRISSSFDLAASSGSVPGPVMGAFTDVAIYDALMCCDVDAIAGTVRCIADALVAARIEHVVADAFEFYNPTHDLCAVVATMASRIASAASGASIQRCDYAVTEGTPADGDVLHLDAADVDRKLAAAYRFENLSQDVDALLASVGTNDVTREVLRTIGLDLVLPRPEVKPYYEVRGEERVRSGRYRSVLRYDEHFVPFVEKLAATFGFQVTAGGGRVLAP